MTSPPKLRIVENAPDDASTSAKSSKRASKQEAILYAAASMFNERGIGMVGFQDIAQELGFGRATLYHYVADKQDLIFRCFQRTCETETEYLDIACELEPGLPQVLEYMRLSLAPTAEQTAIITDIDLLAEGPRQIIGQARRRNHDRLASMIGEGISAGNIRHCDERAIARILRSMISFARMSLRLVPQAETRPDPESFVDFIEWGTARDRNGVFKLYKNADEFSPISVSDFAKRSTSDLRVEQILMKASRLINLHGIDNVSCEDVGVALGASRGTVYHYFRDRQDLLQRCLERSYTLNDAFIDYAMSHGRNGLEKASIVSHLNTQAQVGSLQPVAGWMGVDVLAPEFREYATQRMRVHLERTQEIAAEGIADGSRREHDFQTLTFARAGAYIWIPKWIEEIEKTSPHQMADEVVRLFNSGLRPLG